MNAHVIQAIFRRNFISYFSNPTGYVFICVFVLLSSMAAFWPNEFFNSNLANLDQLNHALPYILLVFIPAITMSIWADERRQGTDELLLTIPATDFDVVLGKYLASVAIFTVSLLFSLVSNWSVLWWLGEPDIGLFFSNYLGYWVVGLTMLAIGMVASFLTGNLTVGFVLGVLFNAPLAFASSAEVILKSPHLAASVERWGISNQFRDFSRGVVSLSSLAYFFGLVALALYVCMVLLGRRHWRGGREGRGVAMHYLVRFIALLAVVVSIDVFLTNHDSLRADLTSEGLSSLSPATKTLLKDLKINPDQPVKIHAYISRQVPENYVQTKLDLLSTLSELKAIGGNKLDVQVREIDPLSEEASVAEQQYGIQPQTVESRVRGARTPEDILLGVAVTCGLDKSVIPFFTRGLPVEYELMRSIATVSQQKRKKVGVLTTDAKLYGGFDMQSMSSTRNELIIDELQKQFDVVQVDPSSPIKEKYDVLLAVQPSSLAPPQMENFIAAVQTGQPTAIFEDPMPFLAGEVPGTLAPKQPPGGQMAMMMRQQPQPKGDVNKLWRLLGVEFVAQNVVWQNYNPYPDIRGQVPNEWVFTTEADMPEAFNQKDNVSSGLQELLFLFAGSIVSVPSSPLTFTPLVRASYSDIGVVPYEEIIERSFMGSRLNPNLPFLEQRTGDRYTLAARITGKLKTENMEMADETADGEEADHEHADHEHADHDHADDESDSAEKDSEKSSAADSAAATEPKINVVLVSDIDCLYSAFFQLRARGSEEGDEIEWRFENVSFVLNILDSLAGDDRLIEIRKHRPVHRTLTKVTRAMEPLLDKARDQKQAFNKKFEKASEDAQRKFQDDITAISKMPDVDQADLLERVAMAKANGEKQLKRVMDQLKKEREKDVKQTQTNVAQTIRHLQDNYKLWGVLLPPIFPLAVAFFVYFNRRAREREGVSKSRLRHK